MPLKLAGGHQAYTPFRKNRTLCLFLCFVDLMFQGKKKENQVWVIVVRKGEKNASEILQRFPFVWGTSLTLEKGDAEPPHNVWLYSWL
jgi:hypothetical protein